MLNSFHPFNLYQESVFTNNSISQTMLHKSYWFLLANSRTVDGRKHACRLCDSIKKKLNTIWKPLEGDACGSKKSSSPIEVYGKITMTWPLEFMGSVTHFGTHWINKVVFFFFQILVMGFSCKPHYYYLMSCQSEVMSQCVVWQSDPPFLVTSDFL